MKDCANVRRPATPDALSIALLEQLNTLEANLAIIGTVAVIAPFVGLFGTVLGIIRAFQDIAIKGNSTPAVVAAGVSVDAGRAAELAGPGHQGLAQEAAGFEVLQQG